MDSRFAENGKKTATTVPVGRFKVSDMPLQRHSDLNHCLDAARCCSAARLQYGALSPVTVTTGHLVWVTTATTRSIVKPTALRRLVTFTPRDHGVPLHVDGNSTRESASNSRQKTFEIGDRLFTSLCFCSMVACLRQKLIVSFYFIPRIITNCHYA